jgi:ATP-dependent Clp protease adaptor protein ClpS
MPLPQIEGIMGQNAAVADPDIADADQAVQTALPKPAKKEKSKPRKQPRYNVILWNDDDHTYEYVITMLLDLFNHPVEKGYQLAQEVDSRGRVIVLTTTMEHAELKRDQIHAYGKDILIDNCRGSMSATIEPVDG